MISTGIRCVESDGIREIKNAQNLNEREENRDVYGT
jgi:hypothetical protein